MSTNKYCFQRSRLSRLLCAAMVSLGIGCGGGTTGTSSTGELNLIGRVEKIAGRPFSQAHMVVFSAATQEALSASQTDSLGRFDILLPGSEKSLELEIDGARAKTIERKFIGSSVLTSVIFKQSEPDNLSNPDGDTRGRGRRVFDVRYTFELRINPDNLCSALQTTDNKIYIKRPIESAPCNVSIEAFSNELENESFHAQLIGICEGNTMPISSSRASSAGEIVVDLSEAYQRRCSSLRISAYSVRTSDTRVIFPVLDAKYEE